ncbi:redoxin [Niastella yeongjuensis]|uniref:Redoxin n=1 Tax=Niastella yeongjuensis TaxID=354355 RepID=A0A1V9F4N1_9BACT|nr:redoxin domain-containing protein [Niastella yeongjuensis]OQP53349.1 redoxin [Niastella yeongjuensis]SEP14353.1 Peroxiredoxin [Niastella yeongjuensis]
MKSALFYLLLLPAICIVAAPVNNIRDEHKTLAIGSKAPDFKLPGIDGKTYTLSSFKNAQVLVIVFTCNHCPTAQAYEDRIIQLTKDYSAKNVAVVAIMPNDPKSVRLDELGYSDMSDHFDEMKARAKQKHFNFPYLYDGDAQATAKAYGPVATPHVFIFDKTRTLRYQGRIDNVEKPTKTPTELNTRDAIDALLQGEPVSVETTKVFGCSIKWAEKTSLVKQGFEEWAKEPVSVNTIDEAGLKDLISNNSDKLRLINIWATWCGPCVTEFPEFISINRMFRRRDFEFISISADDPAKKEKVLKFLQQQQASNTNYLFSIDDKYKLIETVDPKWPGALPYTILVEPGGKIVYGKQGTIDAAEIKKLIVDNKLIGRYY